MPFLTASNCAKGVNNQTPLLVLEQRPGSTYRDAMGMEHWPDPIAFDSRQDCVTGDITHALKAEGFDASEGGTGRGQPITPMAYQRIEAPYIVWRVRRLMPIECERLQGFPDGHTAIPGMKDGPRYKALGNSMCVFVMRWLGIRITWALMR